MRAIVSMIMESLQQYIFCMRYCMLVVDVSADPDASVSVVHRLPSLAAWRW